MRKRLGKEVVRRTGCALLLCVLGALALAPAAGAQERPTPPFTSADDVVDFVDRVAGWIANIFWVVAVIAIFYAGFLYFGSGTNEERLKKAKRQLWYAVIAIAVGLFAFGAPFLIENVLRGK